MARRKKLGDRLGELRYSGMTSETGPRAGSKFTKIIRGDRVFHKYGDDVGAGLGPEVVEVKTPGAAKKFVGDDYALPKRSLADGIKRSITKSGRVMNTHADGRKVVFNEKQTQRALRTNPDLQRQRRRRMARTT